VLFDADDRQIDSLVIHREYTTTGFPAGTKAHEAWSHAWPMTTTSWRVLLRLDVDEQTSRMATTAHAPHGKLAVDVLPALRFYQRLKAPNTFTVAPRFGPVPGLRQALTGEGQATLQTFGSTLPLRSASSRNILHTESVSRTSKTWRKKLIREILRAGALLQGQTSYGAHDTIATEHDATVSDDVRTMTMLVPWKLELKEGS
jgi:hypothetical protein